MERCLGLLWQLLFFLYHFCLLLRESLILFKSFNNLISIVFQYQPYYSTVISSINHGCPQHRLPLHQPWCHQDPSSHRRLHHVLIALRQLVCFPLISWFFHFYHLFFRYGGRSCFGEGRLGYASGLNFVVLIINIVLFILNLLNLAVWKLERIYSIVCTILFAIATGLLLWYMIQQDNWHSTLVITVILLFVQTLLFLWDVKILQGESPN